MWRWRKVRRANIAPELRAQFERYSVSALDHAVGAGELSSKGAELDKVLRENRGEILDWIREQKAGPACSKLHGSKQFWDGQSPRLSPA
jgi:5-methylcytosine-specific restriction endonuclease McrBC GTP-binding regulatory subunit McrB